MLSYVTLVRQLDILYAVNADVSMAVEIQSATISKSCVHIARNSVLIVILFENSKQVVKITVYIEDY